jgi:hypothetical protein
MEEVKDVSPAESEKLHGIISMLSIGDIKCDKCGKSIRHMERYCCNTRECFHCLTIFNNTNELNSHYIETHSPEPARGTRYCTECSMKSGYIRMVKNKKTGEVFPAMLVLRDEELAEKENIKK